MQGGKLEMGLDDSGRTVLRTVYELLRERGTWPTFSVLDRRLDHRGINAQTAVAALPQLYMRRHRQASPFLDKDEIDLTIPGLAATGEADDDLALLARSVQWLAKVEREHDPDETGQALVVTSDQATAELGLDVARDGWRRDMRRLWSLINLVPGVSAGAAWSDEGASWQLTVSRDIRTYRDLRDANDLVQHVREYWQRVDAPRPHASSAGAGPQASSAASAATPQSPVSGDPHPGPDTRPAAAMAYDVFISHASADKQAVVRPLANALRQRGLRVWYDEFELRIGDSLRRKIDEGLASCRFGVVVLSPAFLAANWPQRELDGLVTRDIAGGGGLILPIWHNIDHGGVARYSPTLADKLARSTRDWSTEKIAEEIAAVVRPRPAGEPLPDVAATAGEPDGDTTPALQSDGARPPLGVGLVHQELTAHLGVHELSSQLTAVNTTEPQAAEERSDEPPPDWTAGYWRGKQVLRCPFCSYRTISNEKFTEHGDVHTEPPTPQDGQSVYRVPMAWARVPVHYIGDGPYLNGVPADPSQTLYTSPRRASELAATGLYDLGPLPTETHALAGVGRTLSCRCGFEAATTAEFQGHLASRNP